MCIYEHNIHNDKKAGYFLQKRSIASECILFPVVLCLCIGVKGFPDSSVGKESACNAGDPGSTPGSGRSAGEGLGYSLQYSWTSLVAQLVKNLQCRRPGFDPWVGKILWRRERLPTPVFWPGECHGLQPMRSQRVDMSE